MILDPKKSYARLNNIIYENDMPIIWLKQIFVDVEIMKENVVEVNGKLMVRYEGIIPYLVSAIHGLHKEIDKLKK